MRLSGRTHQASPSVYRRIWSALNLERPEKYANSSASTCFFLKTPLSWYGRRRPRFWRYIFAPASVAGDMLSGVGAGLAVGALDSPRLGRVRRRPVDPLGSEVLWGAFLGAWNVGASLLVVMSRTSP